MIETVTLFFESWSLFRDSVLAGAIAGALLGFLGVYIVLRRMVFLSAALSQTAGFGVTLAFYAQLHLGAPAAVATPTLGAVLLGALVVALLMLDRSADAARRDAVLGVAFLLGSAGTLALATRIVEEIHDVETLLFGTAVAVLPEDLTQLAVVAALLAALHIWWRRGFVAVATDRVDAKVRGLPVRLIEVLLLGSLALAISVTTRILGALPAFAFSILPAMAALRLAPNARVALVLATGIGALSGFVGYFVAYALDLPVGASQTLVGLALLAVAALLGLKRR